MILFIGGFPFFALISIVSVILIWAAEYEKPGWATLTLIATFVALALLGNFNILSIINLYFIQSIVALAAYLLIGVVWGVVKWWFFLSNRRNKYEELKADYIEYELKLPPGSPIPEENKINFTDFYLFARKNDYYYGDLTTPASVRDNKNRIMTWMAFWAPSMIWTLISDPVKIFYYWSYEKLQKIFEAMSARAHKGIELDLKKDPNRP